MDVSRVTIGCRKRSSHQGVTLVELLIVVMIIGIMGTMLAPQLHSVLNETKLNGATTELVSALEYTKSLAIEYQRPFQLRLYRYDHFDLKGNQFTVKDHTSPLDSSIHLDADPPLYSYKRVFHPIDKIPYVIDFDEVQSALVGIVESKHEYRGVNIVSIPWGGTYGDLVFYPDGHSSDTDSSFTLELGGEQRTVTVDGITGNITVN